MSGKIPFSSILKVLGAWTLRRQKVAEKGCARTPVISWFAVAIPEHLVLLSGPRQERQTCTLDSPNDSRVIEAEVTGVYNLGDNAATHTCDEQCWKECAVPDIMVDDSGAKLGPKPFDACVIHASASSDLLPTVQLVKQSKYVLLP